MIKLCKDCANLTTDDGYYRCTISKRDDSFNYITGKLDIGKFDYPNYVRKYGKCKEEAIYFVPKEVERPKASLHSLTFPEK